MGYWALLFNLIETQNILELNDRFYLIFLAVVSKREKTHYIFCVPYETREESFGEL